MTPSAARGTAAPPRGRRNFVTPAVGGDEVVWTVGQGFILAAGGVTLTLGHWASFGAYKCAQLSLRSSV